MFEPPDYSDLGKPVSYEDLAVHIGRSLRGRPQIEIELGTVRPLTEGELALAAQARANTRQPSGAPPEILRLRSRHHLIAQLLASGMKPSEVALKTGYSVSRISILSVDPMFKELLANYTGLAENITFDVKERLRLLSLEAIDELQIRLDEKPDGLDTDQLMKLAEMSLDRTGVGKSQVVAHTYGLDEETAQLLKANRPSARTANLLEGERLGLPSPIDNQRSVGDYPTEQYDLFGPGPPPADSDAAGASQRSLLEQEAVYDPGRETELSPAERNAVSRAVYEDGGSENTVVQFRPARFQSAKAETVDEV